MSAKGEDRYEQVLDGVGPRLRALRLDAGTTLAAVAESTGISISTLSRLESGRRRATLELLLPLASAYQVPLDDLVGAPPVGDPRLHLKPIRHGGQTMIPLTRRPGGMQAYKMLLSPGRDDATPGPQQSHEGYEWMYVLAGRVRLLLGDLDLVLTPGEVAEFDTRTPHWFGATGRRPVELLVLFGPQGERLHVGARPKSG